MYLIVLFLCIAEVCLAQRDFRSGFKKYSQECMQELELDMDLLRLRSPMSFTISPNLQRHNQQCLERCILIKNDFINENETLQEENIMKEFPNINNITMMINQTCPIILNLTDKCEKAFIIGQCIHVHNIRNNKIDRRFKPRPPPIPPHEFSKYRNECLKEIANENLNTSQSTSYEITSGLQDEWCLRRCILIKRGILDENNILQETNIQKYLFGGDQIDIKKCTSIKNENKCRAAADIDLCINILRHK